MKRLGASGLASLALRHIGEPYGEAVILDAFLKIEDHEGLLRMYGSLLRRKGGDRRTVNGAIARAIGRELGRKAEGRIEASSSGLVGDTVARLPVR